MRLILSKVFTNGQNIALLRQVWIKKIVHGVEKHRISSKEQAHWSVKNVMLRVYWDMKGPTIIEFIEKIATINSFFLLLTLFVNK